VFSSIRESLSPINIFILRGERRALMGDCYENASRVRAFARWHVGTLAR